MQLSSLLCVLCTMQISEGVTSSALCEDTMSEFSTGCYKFVMNSDLETLDTSRLNYLMYSIILFVLLVIFLFTFLMGS